MKITLKGTHTGDAFAGIEPSGQAFETVLIAVYTCEAGKVVAERVYYDRHEVAEKLSA